MDFKTIGTKFQGLKVVTPVSRPSSKKQIIPENSNDSVFIMNQELLNQIYFLYKEYIANFSPYMNSCQVLLYLYKQFFNIKNENYTAEYSRQITQLLTNDIVLRFIQE